MKKWPHRECAKDRCTSFPFPIPLSHLISERFTSCCHRALGATPQHQTKRQLKYLFGIENVNVLMTGEKTLSSFVFSKILCGPNKLDKELKIIYVDGYRVISFLCITQKK